MSILMDEVYSHRSVEYINGKFYGAEGGEITKMMLCAMIKSIAGRQRDIVSMVPIVNISADILYSIWKNIVSQVTKIGFDIAVTMTDGHSSNMALFNKRILKDVPMHLSIPNESNPGSSIFMFYDTVHIFKNFYNNWMNKIYFQCPPLVGEDTEN